MEIWLGLCSDIINNSCISVSLSSTQNSTKHHMEVCTMFSLHLSLQFFTVLARKNMWAGVSFFWLLLHLDPETGCSLFCILPSCTHIGGYKWKWKQEDHHAHSFLMILLQHFNSLALFSNGLCRHLRLRPTMGSGLGCACQSHMNESCEPNPFSHSSCFRWNIKINGGQGTDMRVLRERDQRPVGFLM